MGRSTTAARTRNGAEFLALLKRLGVPPVRVRVEPCPGTATEADLLRVIERENQPCELVEGTLVEKPMGAPESGLAMWIGGLLGPFIRQHRLGQLFGGDGTFRLMKGLVRAPDITFIRGEKLPGGLLPVEAVPELAPDLAVEVLSPSNTRAEMERKRKEYFLAGTTLVWMVDLERRVVEVYTAPDVFTTLTEDDTLDGGELLPGFSVSVREVFEQLPELPRLRRSRKKKPGK